MTSGVDLGKPLPGFDRPFDAETIRSALTAREAAPQPQAPWDVNWATPAAQEQPEEPGMTVAQAAAQAWDNVRNVVGAGPMADPSTYRGRMPDGSLRTEADDKRENPNGPVMTAAAPRSNLERIGDSFVGTAEHYSPAALAARALARWVPSEEGYSGMPGADNSPAAITARSAPLVTQRERAWRDLQSQQAAADPIWHPNDGWLNPGALSRGAADLLGGVGAGFISDPTSALAPGESYLAKVGAQAGISGVVDAATQGGELGEGTRDQFDPVQTLFSAAAGGTLTGVVEGVSALRQKWRDRGVNLDNVPDDQLVSGSLDGSFGEGIHPDEVATILQGVGSSPDHFSSPERAAAAAERVQGRGNAVRGAGIGSKGAPILEDYRLPAVNLEPTGDTAVPPLPGFAIDEAPLPGAKPRRARGGGNVVDITASTESGGNRFNPDGSVVTSPKGARGEMQVMPSTARDPGYGIKASDGTLADDARVGREYLAKMQQHYGDMEKVWAAYNAGPGALNKAMREHGADWLAHMPDETRAYVAKNMAKLGGNPGAAIEPDGVAFEVRPQRVENAPPDAPSSAERVAEALTDHSPETPPHELPWAASKAEPEPEAPKPAGIAHEPPPAPEPVMKSYEPPKPVEAERPAVPEPTRPHIVGTPEQVVTARGRPIDTEFQVHEARDLIPSIRPEFDPALQPRDRASRSSSDAQIADTASRLDPEQLHSSRQAAQGAPIIGPDRMVESGNGRVSAIQRAYDLHPEKAKAYRDMIEARGLSTEGFDQPVLVRKRTTDLSPEDRQAFVREANERDTMGMSSTEQAKVDSGAMSRDTLDMYRGGGVADAGNRDFARRWMDEVATPAERNTLMMPDGSLSSDGVRRMRTSLLSKAFDDPELVAKVVEDPDTEIRAIGNTLTDAAPAFAKIKERVAKGDLPAEYDITGKVAEAAKLIARARNEGKKVGDLIRQDDMFGGRTDPTTEAVTRLMFKDAEMTKPRSAADMAEGLRYFTTEAEKHSGVDMFGGSASPERAVSILDAGRKKLEAKVGAPQVMFLQHDGTTRKAATAEVNELRETASDRAMQRLIAEERRQSLGLHEGAPQRATTTLLRRAVIDEKAGRITPEMFARRIEGILGDAYEKSALKRYRAATRDRLRGADYIRERLLQAQRRGQLSPETVDFADWFIRQNPALLDELAISVRNPRAGEADARGTYNPAARMMTLFEGRDVTTTAVHEILHHTERMMPTDFQQAIHAEWTRRIGQLAEGSQAERDFAAAVAKAQVEPNQANLDAAIRAMPEPSYYQFVNPSEFWAVNTQRLLSARFTAAHSIFARVRNWMGEMLQHARSALGLASDAPMLRALRRLTRNGDEGASGQMLTTATRFHDEAPRDEGPTNPKSWGVIGNMIFDPEFRRGDAAAASKTVRETFGNPKSALTRTGDRLKAFGEVTAYSADGALRSMAGRFNSPTIAKMADLFHAEAGKTGEAVGRTFDEAVTHQRGRFLGDLNKALKPFHDNKPSLERIRHLLAEPTRTDLRASVPERAAAATVRDLLKEIHDYRLDAGETLGEVKDGYFPRQMRADKVFANPETFLQAAEKTYRQAGLEGEEATKAATAWLQANIDGHLGIADGLNSYPGSAGTRSTKAREFGTYADANMRDFYETNPMVALTNYIAGAVKKAEENRRFGMPGRAETGDGPGTKFGNAKRTASDERKAWVAEHGDKTQWDVMRDQIRAELRANGAQSTGVVERVSQLRDNNLGKVRSSSPKVTSAVSLVHAWNQLGTLGRAVFSSLPELAMGFVRAGPRLGFTHMATTFGEVGRLLARADPSDAARWADAVGAIGSDNSLALLRARADDPAANVGSSKVLDQFYRKSGLEGWTRAGRTAAVKTGQKFIDVLVGDLKSPSARVSTRAAGYLRELGIKDPAAFAAQMDAARPTVEGLRARDRGFEAEYATALLRFANQTVLLPSRAVKPGWASHPLGSLIFALQSYNYAFKKNVLDRVGRQTVAAFKEKDLTKLGPAAGLVMLTGITALITGLRHQLYGGNGDPAHPQSDTAYALESLDRAGMFGALSPVFNAFAGLRYRRSVGHVLEGSVLGRTFDGLDAVGSLALDNSPNTNTAERKAAGAVYDLAVKPVENAVGASVLRGLLGSSVILGTGARDDGALPSDKEWFTSTLAGGKSDGKDAFTNDRDKGVK